MQPLVSTLVPAYNAQEWIADTLRSAISQAWKVKEIIVVDDPLRLPGGMNRMASAYSPRIIKVLSQRGTKPSGDYIQWLDADDLLAPDKVERELI